MRRLALLLAAGLAVTAAPATAQSWSGTYDASYSHGPRGDRNAAPSAFDWRSQLDRPGDYRCDAFWDASRTDCGEGWRDQRRRVSPQARRDYRQLAGYGRDGDGYGGYGYNRYGYGGGYGGQGYSTRHRGHGSNQRYDQGGAAYYGAYGRPDLVYPAGGRTYNSHASHGSRADWCRASYRSYDPHTGYYRAYSGRLIYCG
ncbi:MAG: BA14K family protein [Brevundimonas sp.]|uniref:BA14K family protein n=1 Tax=Brevundimonas sp. TaxID=1871086 RepID=UPI00248A470A|nr:BA14K family protein [Brevundimonas sp.]MDI1325931.1 BA14K family protein [Brevundimonas sp.]